MIYTRPPITEAVVGVTFASKIEPAKLSLASDRFAKHYPHHQPLENLDVQVAVNVNADKSKKATANISEEKGHRRSTINMSELLVLLPTSFMLSQLAPYPGWSAFSKRFKRDWGVWKKAVGFHQISRIGVRYINRIDIPVTGPLVEHEQFLLLYPQVPAAIGPIGAYGVQTVSSLNDIGCQLTLNSAAVESPILNHDSFILDQDISRISDVPQSEKDILELLEAIRLKKNAIFEACISDRARTELFHHDDS